MKANLHKRLKHLEEIRARELKVVRCREDDEDYRLAREKITERIDAYVQEHGMPEEPPEGLAKAVQNLRYQLMERAAGRL